MSAQERLVAWVNQQVGYHEGTGNQNKYANMAQEALGWNANGQPWCSVFVAAAFSQVFGADIGSRMLCSTKGQVSAAVSQNAVAFRSAGQLKGQPEVGDQVFYNGYNHTGVVTAVNGNQITTVDGNYSDAVTRRTLSKTDAQINGFGRPLWNLAPDSGSTVTETKSETTETREFKKGDLVSVNAGSMWYVGGACNALVYNHNWYVVSQFNDRVVINESDDGLYHIMSPIAASNLTLVQAAEEESALAEVEAVEEDPVDDTVYPTDKEVLPASEPPTVIVQAQQKPTSELFGIGQMLLNKIRNMGGHISD